MENDLYQDSVSLVGRVLIGGIFLMAGFNKILGFAGTLGFMQSTGMTFATEFFLILAIIIEVLGGLALIFGCKTRIVAGVIAFFTLVATIIFHNPSVSGQMIFFTKNVMIIGGLLLLSGFGSGRVSLDQRCINKK